MANAIPQHIRENYDATEWAGLGGDTLNLTADEIAVARGAQ